MPEAPIGAWPWPPPATELAWAAGFFDGEGCYSRNGRAKRAMVSVTQVDVRPLARFHKLFPALRLNGPYPKPPPSRHPQFILRSSDKHVVSDVLTALWPYLSEPKKEQVKRVDARRDAELRVAEQGVLRL